jgi:hypothetical protein
MDDIETLRAELARVNKLREQFAKKIDELAEENFRLREEIAWYAETGRKPREKRAVVPRNKDGTKLQKMKDDKASTAERTYGRGVDRLLYGS